MRKEAFVFSVLVQLRGGVVIPSTPLHVAAAPDSMRLQSIGSPVDAQGNYIKGIGKDEDEDADEDEERITLVLPLVFNDVPRSFILLTSLAILDSNLVKELLIFSPTRDLVAVQALLEGPIARLSFPVRVHPDSALLGSTRVDSAYPYAIQMSLKLLVHSMVTTPFYMTLDADVILLRKFHYADIVDDEGRALYHHESRAEVHGWWWDGSESVLGVEGGSVEERAQQGFGVTPALLSTRGADLTVEMLAVAAAKANDQSSVTDKPSVLEWWINAFGKNDVVWSEYTLYAVTLHHHKVRGGFRFCCYIMDSIQYILILLLTLLIFYRL
jgi:hypothetical protein